MSGRAEIRGGYPVCTGGFGQKWHEPVNMRIESVGPAAVPGEQQEMWRCPECWQEFACTVPERPTT